MTQKEQNYLKAIQTADRKGIEQIYSDFLPRIIKLITSNGGSHDDAEDVFQQAMMVMYEKSKAPDFSLTSNFYTMLHGICRNLWGNRLQKKSFGEVTLPDDLKYTTGESVEADIQEAEEKQVFWEAFQYLGEDCRKLLSLFFEKVKMEEIMKIMGFGSIGYTKKRKFQCKEKLIDRIKNDARYEELKEGFEKK